MKSTCALEVISPASSTRPVVQRVSAATRDFGSCARRASRTASETWSATLSGWPSETDSEVNRYSWAMASLLENRGEPPGFFGGVAGSGRSGDALAVLVSGLAAGVAPQVVINSATVGPNYIARCRLRTTPRPPAVRIRIDWSPSPVSLATTRAWPVARHRRPVPDHDRYPTSGVHARTPLAGPHCGPAAASGAARHRGAAGPDRLCGVAVVPTPHDREPGAGGVRRRAGDPPPGRRRGRTDGGGTPLDLVAFAGRGRAAHGLRRRARHRGGARRSPRGALPHSPHRRVRGHGPVLRREMADHGALPTAQAGLAGGAGRLVPVLPGDAGGARRRGRPARHAEGAARGRGGRAAARPGTRPGRRRLGAFLRQARLHHDPAGAARGPDRRGGGARGRRAPAGRTRLAAPSRAHAR